MREESRNLLIQAYNNAQSAKEVAEQFSVDVSTVYRLVRQARMEGTVFVRPSCKGRKAALQETDLQRIQALVELIPEITLQEIVDLLRLETSGETVRKALIRLGYSRKSKPPQSPRCTSKTHRMGRKGIWCKC